MSPLEVEVGQDYDSLWEDIRSRGYARVRVDGQTHSLETPPSVNRRRKHRVEIVVDRITVSPQSRARIAESVEQTLALGRELCMWHLWRKECRKTNGL